jgi:hypothetical protein
MDAAENDSWDLANIWFGKQRKKSYQTAMITFSYHSTCYLLYGTDLSENRGKKLQNNNDNIFIPLYLLYTVCH